MAETDILYEQNLNRFVLMAGQAAVQAGNFDCFRDGIAVLFPEDKFMPGGKEKGWFFLSEKQASVSDTDILLARKSQIFEKKDGSRSCLVENFVRLVAKTMLQRMRMGEQVRRLGTALQDCFDLVAGHEAGEEFVRAMLQHALRQANISE